MRRPSRLKAATSNQEMNDDRFAPDGSLADIFRSDPQLDGRFFFDLDAVDLSSDPTRARFETGGLELNIANDGGMIDLSDFTFEIFLMNGTVADNFTLIATRQMVSFNETITITASDAQNGIPDGAKPTLEMFLDVLENRTLRLVYSADSFVENYVIDGAVREDITMSEVPLPGALVLFVAGAAAIARRTAFPKHKA